MTETGFNRAMHFRNTLLMFVSIFAGVAFLSVGLSCSKQKSPREQIQELIDSAQQSAEEKRPGGVTIHLTDDFSDNHGNDKQTIKAVLIREMMTNNKLATYVTTNEISVQDNEATALLKIIITGSTGWLPDRMENIRVELKLRRVEGNKWMVHYADWKLSGEQQ